ncbi:kinesin-like protein KIN-7C, mitochondrial [Prosopis cineraria]|uniref:kinesin-like protein KIN-7C, mitochondrial n=1 Tax=Prosopis cineraria TaxID=364024 RepID=UPI00240F00F5|nr:kinesin-like protein KIN-7C, mitochondrial [Prosopis cineraria]
MSAAGYSRSQRASSTVSPFRSRKSPSAPPPVAKSLGRPTTPSSITSSRPSRKLAISPASPSPSTLDRPEVSKAKENVTVTVRLRPLSAREIHKGDEIAWYADGDHIVRNEHNPSVAYGFDKVFGPATTTRHVYDVAAQHVISGAMEGINGTVFAYGVTSSGKTHTMHGEQKSPGIIPLAVKDVFSIIQETPGREFLLRVSYLEIYNEVINDLLDPTGQNLRIREDAQGTYVEGIKEEVVLSPAHALSLIATGEEHRHVGSNNFNLVSSRSHTIFTLTIESSTRGENIGEEDVTLSHLHLIDLAGSESSKAETTGMRRKEGSYINKSLLTLGTVISKLTDGKATHIPYRDSKLTRLLQSSLSGHGQISLICTVTPASSSSEETHNTLKFASRSKHVEIKASQNKIMDEKSLIKKYQREIHDLKQELQQLKRGILQNPNAAVSSQEDLVNLKLQLEAGQSKLQSRLEEEEQAKAALMGRIQRLTKLILVSTKTAMPSNIPERLGHRRRHSFGEDELAYLPDRKRDNLIDDDPGSHASEPSVEGKDDVNLDELMKDYKRNKRRGMLGWFKLRKPDQGGLSPNFDSESPTNVSPASSLKQLPNRVLLHDMKDSRRNSISTRDNALAFNSFPFRNQAGDLFSETIRGRQIPWTGSTMTDQMDLLREQVKMLAGEVALCTSSLKRLSEQAVGGPEDSQLREHMQKLKDEISQKKDQIRILEQRMLEPLRMTAFAPNNSDMSEALAKVTSELNEKIFELEIKSADNRILQEQLQSMNLESADMQDTILMLRQQLDLLKNKTSDNYQPLAESETEPHNMCFEVMSEETHEPSSVANSNIQEHSTQGSSNSIYSSQILMQAAEIENLRQEKVRLAEEKDGLEIQSHTLAQEASYAKELAAAAAVELRNLAEEVTKLSCENAELSGDLAAAKVACCKSNCCQRSASYDDKQSNNNTQQQDGQSRKLGNDVLIEKLQKDLKAGFQREAALEAALSAKDQIEAELRRRLDETKHHEQDLENELASMRVLVAKMRKFGVNSEDKSTVYKPNDVQNRVKNGLRPTNGNANRKIYKEDEIFETTEEMIALEELKASYQRERRRCKELESVISRLKGEDVAGLDVVALEELQNIHIESITKICQAKYANQDL